MPEDRSGPPWSGLTYNGFAGPRTEDPAAWTAPRPPPPRRGGPRPAMVAGVAAALLAGLGIGLALRPDPEPTRGAVQAEAAAEAAAPRMPIEVAKVEPEVIPAPTGKLEVLPPDLARDAERRAAGTLRPPPPLPPQARAAPAAPMAPVGMSAPVVATAPSPPPAVQAPVAPAAPAPVLAQARERPSFNCRYARTRSEAMVCDDPRLAQLDRRLDSAFQRAVSAGAPYRDLRDDQDDWLGIREDAARYGRGAVANVYEQRIAELNEMAR